MTAIEEEAVLRGSALIYQAVFSTIGRPARIMDRRMEKEHKKGTQPSPGSRFSSVQKAGYGPLPRMLESGTTV